MALGPDDTRHGSVQHLEDLLRIERPPGAIDERRNPVFLGFGHVLGKTVELLGPGWMQMRPVEVESPGVEDRRAGHPSVIRLDDPRVRVQRGNDLARRVQPLGPRIADLVQNHDIGEFDLIDQQIDQRPVIALAQAFAPIPDEIMAAVIAQQVDRVHHRHHRVQPRHVRKAGACFITKLEGGRHRQGLGDPGALDQQIVKAPLVGQSPHLLQQIVPQGAADAAVGHFDQPLFGMTEICLATAHEVRVDVHLGHVIDNDGDPPPLAVVQDRIQERRLSGPQEPRQDGDGKAWV